MKVQRMYRVKDERVNCAGAVNSGGTAGYPVPCYEGHKMSRRSFYEGAH